jgi:hypothetical protein
MPPQVCVHTQIPSTDQTVAPGGIYSCYFNIKNCGTETGNFYYGIEKDDVACKSEYNLSLKVGEIGYQITCSFTMPANPVKIRYFAGYAEGGVWKEKYSKTITITPPGKAIIDIVSASMSPTTINAGENTTITALIKNVGARADTPRYKILAGTTVIGTFDDDVGSLGVNVTRTKYFTFSILTAGTYTITLKAWAKTDESEPS